jgi:hypothetical protein
MQIRQESSERRCNYLEDGASKNDLVNHFSERASRRREITTSWYNREVSRGHSTHGKRGAENCIGLISGEGLNAVLLEITMGALIFANWATDSQENL